MPRWSLCPGLYGSSARRLLCGKEMWRPSGPSWGAMSNLRDTSSFPKEVLFHPMSGWMLFFCTDGALVDLCHLLHWGFQGPLRCILYVPGDRNPTFLSGIWGRISCWCRWWSLQGRQSKTWKRGGDQQGLASAESFLCRFVMPMEITFMDMEDKY